MRSTNVACVCVWRWVWGSWLTGRQRSASIPASSSSSPSPSSLCALGSKCCSSVPFSRKGVRQPPIVSGFKTGVWWTASPIGPAISSLEKSSRSSIWNISAKLLPAASAAATVKGFCCCCCFLRELSNATSPAGKRRAPESIAKHPPEQTTPPSLSLCIALSSFLDWWHSQLRRKNCHPIEKCFPQSLSL